MGYTPFEAAAEAKSKVEQEGRSFVIRQPSSVGSELLRGAAVLGAAAMISKLIGTLQKIPLQNVAGDGVYGIYSAVYPLYVLILFLATAGFPVAVSKFVSERAAIGDHRGAGRVAAVSALILGFTGLFFFLLLYIGADRLAGWIGVSQTEKAIRSVSFALLLAPFMAVLRGYFQGYHQMVPTAMSQIAEQVVRVATMILLLIVLVSSGASADWIAAGAAFGSVTGAAAGLLVMAAYWLRMRNRRKWGIAGRDEPQAVFEENSLQLAKRIAAYAIPICLGAIVTPILTIVDALTIPRILQGSGWSEMETMRQFGLYNRGLPLVQLVAMIASSMSAALVPAIAEARIRGDRLLIRRRTELSFRLTWMIGLAASCGLAFTTVPINIMLYKTNEGGWTMAILAFTTVFSALNIVAGSVLQGVGEVRAPAFNLFIAAVLKTIGNVCLVPRWGIEGAALSAVFAFAVAAGLNLVQAVRCTGARFALRRYAAWPTLAVGLMGGCLAALQLAGARAVPAWLPGHERWAYSAIALTCVAGGAAVYAGVLLRTGVIGRGDLALLPSLDRKLTPLLLRMKLIPKRDEEEAQH